jgi:putative ABC transport system ATP-binding protein
VAGHPTLAPGNRPDEDAPGRGGAGSDIRAEPVFTAHGVTKVYRSGEVEVHALRGVDLELYEGEIAVMLGPSGSGKSTLLNIMGGLDRATAGTVRFRDHDLTNASERQLTRYRRDHVGFVFQFYNLIPSLTAWENVALVTEIASDPMTPDEALELVGLKDRMTHFPAQLSGGEQQRVAIARAIAKRPEVLLCDEPTGALDSKTGILVLEALTRINEELKTTLAIITHNAGIRQIAHRVFTFRDGRIAETVTNATRAQPSEVTW